MDCIFASGKSAATLSEETKQRVGVGSVRSCPQVNFVNKVTGKQPIQKKMV